MARPRGSVPHDGSPARSALLRFRISAYYANVITRPLREALHGAGRFSDGRLRYGSVPDHSATAHFRVGNSRLILVFAWREIYKKGSLARNRLLKTRLAALCTTHNLPRLIEIPVSHKSATQFVYHVLLIARAVLAFWQRICP